MKHNPAEEIYIYYDHWANGLIALLLGSCSIYFFYFSINNGSLGAIVLALFGGIVSCLALKRAVNRTPQLIINNKGIKPIARKLIPWGNIANTVIKVKGGPKNKRMYLQIYARNKKGRASILTEIDFTDLGISNNKLETIILRFKRAHRLKQTTTTPLQSSNGIRKKRKGILKSDLSEGK